MCEGNLNVVNAASWVTATGVVVALVIGTGTVVQRWRADRGTHWWNRTQWALDLSLNSDDEEKARLGIEVLTYILRSKLSTREQADFIEIAADRVLSQRRYLDTSDERGDW